MLPSILVIGMLAMQLRPAAGITPELACGPEYHEFSPEIVSPHTPKTISIEEILSDEVVVEGTVTTKRTYAAFGVENDVKLRVTKVLKGTEPTVGDVITVHVNGGYAADGKDSHVCLRDTLSDGVRIEVGKSYLVPLHKRLETGAYHSLDLAGWFRIAPNGDIVPLTPDLVRNKALVGKKVADVEARANGEQQ